MNDLTFLENELKAIRSFTKEESEEAIRKANRKELTKEEASFFCEGNLYRILPIAKKYAVGNKNISLSVLFQEGSYAILDFIHQESISLDTWESDLNDLIFKAITSYRNNESEAKHSEEEIAAELNRMEEITTAFTKKNHRSPSVKELAEEMHISEDGIQTLMQIALDAINHLEGDIPEGKDKV